MGESFDGFEGTRVIKKRIKILQELGIEVLQELEPLHYSLALLIVQWSVVSADEGRNIFAEAISKDSLYWTCTAGLQTLQNLLDAACFYDYNWYDAICEFQRER